MSGNTAFDLLERLCALLRSDNRQAATRHGLQPVHLDVLRYLARCNRYSNTPAAIAQYLNCTKGTVSQSINVLLRNGLLAKISDRQDKRVIRLKLLKKGERLIADPEDRSALYNAVGTLDSAELQELEHTLQQLLRTAQRHNDHQTFGQCQTCKHFRQQSGGRFQCGLTGEALSTSDASKICVEHELKVA